MPTLVYKTGLLPPHQNAALVREQLRLAAAYRNTLVEIERARRAAVRPYETAQAAIPQLMAAVVAAQTELDAALLAIRSARAASRSRSETVPMRERCTVAREARRQARAALAQARRDAKEDPDPAVQAEKDRIHNLAAGLQRGAREISGLYWGTYQLVEQAAGDSFSDLPMFRNGTEPNDPGFVRFRGEGSLGVQIQIDKCAACKARDALVPPAEGKRVLEPCPHSRWYMDRFEGESNFLRIEQEPGRRDRILHMRIGSDATGGPIWGSWRMAPDRPFPPGSVLKRASVRVRKVGPREVWSVQFTIETPAVQWVAQNDKRVAVDVGWRQFPDGSIRAAYALGSDGQEFDLRLPRFIDALGRVEGLQRVRDSNFNTARRALVDVLRGLTLPEWLTRATETLPHWRSPARLGALCRRWAHNRFEGDAAVFDQLEAWRYHDYHLWSYESDEREKHLNRRRDTYRVWARQLARSYQTLVLEDFDLRDVAVIPQADSEETTIEQARANRQRTAVSELRLALINAFGKANTEKVSAVDSTHICHVHPELGAEEFDAAAEVDHTWACGCVWDQDLNACHILLGREPQGDAQTPGSPRTGEAGAPAQENETRWQRVARLAVERQRRQAPAREEVSNLVE
jgi:hypothetical protein